MAMPSRPITLLCALLIWASFHSAHATTINRPPLRIGLEQGLVGYWTFDESNMGPRSATDVSGNGNIASFVNTPQRALGRIGQALSFNGTSDYLTVTDTAALQVGSVSTVSFWMSYSRIDPNPSRIFFEASDVNNDWAIAITASSYSEPLAIYVTEHVAGVADTKRTPLNSVPNANQWYHITVQFSGGAVLAIYINGIAQSLTSTAALVPGGAGFLYIGARDNNRWFGGLLDDIRIYNRVLSPDEIKRLYNLGGTFKVNKPANSGSLTSGLVGYWTFDESTMGTTSANDVSGQGNTGWLIKGPTRAIGRIGQALNFNGSNAFVRLQPSLLNIGASDFSISAWVNISSNASGVIFVKGCNGIPSYIALNGPTPILNFEDALGNDLTAQDSAPMVTGRWYHIVGVRNSAANQALIYVNGTLRNAQTNASVGDASTNFSALIGADCQGVGSNWAGSIDDVRVYNRALSPDEIKRLYNLGGTFKVNKPANSGSLTSGLVGYWTFDGSDMGTTSALDVSGNNHIGWTVGTVSKNIGSIGQALRFTNGVTSCVQIPDESAFDFDRSSPFSVSMRIRPSETTGSRYLMGKSLGGASDPGWILQIGGANRFVDVTLQNGTGGKIEVDNRSTSIRDPKWYHLVMTYDGLSVAAGLHIYIDGTESNRNEASDNLSSGSILNDVIPTIGGLNLANACTAASSFDGLIDDVRIYNRVLTTDEVKRLYLMGK